MQTPNSKTISKLTKDKKEIYSFKNAKPKLYLQIQCVKNEQRQYLTIQIQNAKTIYHLANTNCKDIISPYIYRMQRQYLNLQKQDTKTISHLTHTKCKDTISPYKYKMQRQYLALQIQNSKTISHLKNT